jgi:ABC-type transporter Mla subunit MlaD
LRAAAVRLRQVLANPSFDTLPDDVVSAANRVRALADSERLHRAIANLDSILARLDQTLAGSEHDIAATLSNLRQTTENLRELTEAARRYPAGTLFGEPPAPVRRSE